MSESDASSRSDRPKLAAVESTRAGAPEPAGGEAPAERETPAASAAAPAAGPAPRRTGGAGAILLLVLLAACVIGLVRQVQITRGLEGEIDDLRARLATTATELEASRSRMAEVRLRVGDLRERLLALDEVLGLGPAAASGSASGGESEPAPAP